MAVFQEKEVEEVFRRYWLTGSVREDWNAWCDLFTPDVVIDERIYGRMEGRETVRQWIVPLMERYPELYGVLDWYKVDTSGRVVFRMVNRRDHPGGLAPVDFPGVSILQYAGDGLFSHEEDYWAEKQAMEMHHVYEAALKEHDPDYRAKATRLNTGWGHDWARATS